MAGILDTLDATEQGLVTKLKAEGKKAWTIKKILTPLVGALKDAVREGWLQSNPAERLLPHERPKADQKEMRVLDSNEIEALLREASTERWRTLFMTLVFTGLRISEALALQWEDVGEDEIRVRGTKTKAADRTVMLIPRLRSALVQYRLASGRHTGPVFANAHGTPVSRREALRALRAAEKRAGLADYTLHELRHTFASILLSSGTSPRVVMKLLGHSTIRVTMDVYAHVSPAEARRAVEAFISGA